MADFAVFSVVGKRKENEYNFNKSKTITSTPTTGMWTSNTDRTQRTTSPGIVLLFRMRNVPTWFSFIKSSFDSSLLNVPKNQLIEKRKEVCQFNLIDFLFIFRNSPVLVVRVEIASWTTHFVCVCWLRVVYANVLREKTIPPQSGLRKQLYEEKERNVTWTINKWLKISTSWLPVRSEHTDGGANRTNFSEVWEEEEKSRHTHTADWKKNTNKQDSGGGRRGTKACDSHGERERRRNQRVLSRSSVFYLAVDHPKSAVFFLPITWTYADQPKRESIERMCAVRPFSGQCQCQQ